MDSRASVIVKVGKTSNIRFRNIDAIRAITFDDVPRLIRAYPNVSAVIVESILENERDKAIQAIEFTRDREKEVFLHVINGANSIEEEVAKSNNIGISKTLDELQHSISLRLAIKAYTHWGRKLNLQESTGSEESEVTVVAQVSKKAGETNIREALSAIEESKAVEAEVERISNKEELHSKFGIIELSPGFFEKDIAEKRLYQDTLQKEKDQSYIELNKLLEAVTKEKQDLKSQLGQAFDKITELMDIRQAVENERDKYRDAVAELEGSVVSLDGYVPESQLEEVKEKLSSLQLSNIDLEQRIIEYKANISAAEQRTRVMSDNVTAAQQEIDKLGADIAERDSRIQQLRESLSDSESVKIELLNVKSHKATLERTVESLKSKVSELNKEIDTAMGMSSTADLEKIQTLRDEIEQLNSEISSSNSEKSMETRARLVVNMMLTEAINQKDIVDRALVEKNGEIARLTAVEKELENSIRSSQRDFELVQRKYDELVENQQSTEEQHNIEKEKIRSEYSAKVDELKISLDTRGQEVRRLRKEISEVRKSLGEKEMELTNMLITSGNSKQAVKDAIEAKAVLEESNEKLVETVKLLKREVQSLNSKIYMTEDANERLEQVNRNLRVSIATFKATASAGDGKDGGKPVLGKIRLECDYGGRGLIIPVFGSGSYGITTTAITIARRLPRSSVLYMDLDTVSPKADAWFGKMPIIKELTDIPDTLKRSGFSALIEKGSGYVFDNKQHIFQRALETKQGTTIDYFSGAYTKIDPRKLLTVDFSEFLTHLGNMYNFLIVDLGRFGSSDVSDELIKMFNKIAYKSVIITLNNKFDTRNMSVRLSAEKIKLEDAIWILNMSDSSKVDNMVQKSMGAAKPVIIPKDMSIYGSGMSFDKVPVIKDRFMRVMELLNE